MCNPTPTHNPIQAPWVLCQDDSTVRHYQSNPDITCGPDHDFPHLFSVTDGAGTFLFRNTTAFTAIEDFLLSPHAAV